MNSTMAKRYRQQFILYSLGEIHNTLSPDKKKEINKFECIQERILKVETVGEFTPCDQAERQDLEQERL